LVALLAFAADTKSTSSKKITPTRTSRKKPKKSAVKPSGIKPSKSQSMSAKKPSTAATAVKKPSTKRKSSRKTAAKSRSWRSGQQVPTPSRYKEIQTALAERGYLEGPATGQWDAKSVEALKKFQQDRNLQPTGKLDSLSLIALGLGPKREGNTTVGQASTGAAQPAGQAPTGQAPGRASP
jgi:hypothetical protein